MKKISNFFINCFYYPLVLVSLVGIISLTLNEILSLPKSGIIILDLIIFTLIVIVAILKLHKNIFENLVYYFKKNVTIFKIICVVIIFIWQGLLIFTITGFSTWDPGIIILQATNHKQWATNYFSYNPNTLFMLFFEHFMWKILHYPSVKTLTYVLNILNMLILDISVFFFGREIQKNYGKLISIYVVNVCIVLMIITPWICLPYSDVAAFSFSIFTFICLVRLKKRFSYKYSVLTGVLLSFDYLIKPSLIIVFIAYLITSEVFFTKGKSFLKSILIVLLVIMVVISGFNLYKQNNHFIKIDNAKALSMIHFADMGITGDGGYNLADVNHDIAISDPEKRKKSDITIWVNRFESLGMTGYQKFLVNKQVANTNDVSFHWGKEGEFIRSFNDSKNIKNSLMRRLYTDNDGVARKYNDTFSFFLQVLWIIIFLNLLFVGNINNFIGQFLKYTVVGFFVFLLIFEAGRSRYLIQFLPLLTLLSGFGLSNIVHFIGKNKLLNKQIRTV